MSYGLRVTNDNGQVIMDSDLFSYHFVSKVSSSNSWVNPDLLVGNSGHYGSPNTIDSSQETGRIFEYTFSSNGPKPPMCFIKPTATGVNAPFAGQVLCSRVGTEWKIWVLQTSQDLTGPILYCFSPVDQLSNYTSETHGLQALNANSEITFDTRLKPLRVSASGGVDTTVLPHSGSTGSGTNATLEVNTSKTFSTGANVAAGDQIYYCPSLASACQEHTTSRSDSGWNNWSYYEYARGDIWWCFYRSGLRIDDDNTLSSSWVTYVSGHAWEEAQSSSSILGWLALGLFTGGAAWVAVGLIATTQFTSVPTIGGVYHPYTNSSRNASEQNNYIITKASFYD